MRAHVVVGNEGLIRFDIIFYVCMKDGISQVIVNLEAQKDEPWVCMNMDENSMAYVHLAKDDLLGSYQWQGGLDLLNIVLIGISDKILDVIENGTGFSSARKKHHEKYRLRDMAIVVLILDTGIRISELNALNIDDYDRGFSQLYIQKIAIKVNKDTKEKLEQYIDQGRTVLEGADSRQSPLFVTSNGKRLAVRSIQSILKKYSVAADNPQVISAGKLRQISAEKYYQETGDMQGLKERLGVKSMAAVEKYILKGERQ